MVSLAGIPPLAGFFGKFLLLKAVIQSAQATANHGYYCLAFTALAGVVMSLYYYFGVIRAIYWNKDAADLSPILLSGPAKFTLVHLHRRNVLDRFVPEHAGQSRHGSGEGVAFDRLPDPPGTDLLPPGPVCKGKMAHFEFFPGVGWSSEHGNFVSLKKSTRPANGWELSVSVCFLSHCDGTTSMRL